MVVVEKAVNYILGQPDGMSLFPFFSTVWF